MKKLYAPWRSTYTTSTAQKEESTTTEFCIFCKKLQDQTDRDHYILKRFTHHAVLLNLYPYNAGHLLIVPYEHVQKLNMLKPEARTELIELAQHCADIAINTLDAQGINIGLNLGKAAGAGIPSHLHMHVLPRWIGDTNFLPTIADTKAVSYDLNIMYDQLKKPFDDLTL